MIFNTFLFLKGISASTEEKLWSLGIQDWECFLAARTIPGISQKRKQAFNACIKEAKHNLYSGNIEYFTGRLPAVEHWRLYPVFKTEAVFLDIETSGVEEDAYITVIGLYDGERTKTMIKGVNLDPGILKKELQHYKMIVSFNGSAFDLPHIEKRFPELLPNSLHMDLRHLCARMGLKGGLKQVERELGIKRTNPIVERLYGGDALTLWKMFRATGDEYYLHLLVEYNEEDCVNLQIIAEKIMKKIQTNFYELNGSMLPLACSSSR